MDAQCLRVMLDPLSYCDASRLPVGRPDTAEARAVLNHWLIRQYRLPSAPERALNAQEREICSLWFYLRRSAYLIGAYRRRNAVLQQIGFQRCDPVLQRFLQLQLPGIPHQGAVCAVDESSLLRQGTDVLEPWVRALSPAWRMRAELLFPEESVVWSRPSGEALDRSLIFLAIHYAKTT
jgi:type III secretion system OrgA/MxiK family protein